MWKKKTIMTCCSLALNNWFFGIVQTLTKISRRISFIITLTDIGDILSNVVVFIKRIIKRKIIVVVFGIIGVVIVVVVRYCKTLSGRIRCRGRRGNSGKKRK